MDENIENVDVDQSRSPEFQTIGNFLSAEREKNGLTLREISKNTKIGTTMLELLESDELDQLPNRAYVAGYVKSYAKEVCVDAEMALTILEETYARFEGAHKKAEKEKKIEKAAPIAAHFRIPIPKLITAFGVIVLLAMGYTYFANKPKKLDKTLVAQEEVTPKTVSETTPLQKEIVVAKQTQEEKEVEETAKEEKVAEKVKVEDKKEQKKEEKKEKKEVKKTLRPITAPLYSTKDATAEELAKISKATKSQYVDGLQNLVIISNDENTWMTYKKDQDPIKQFKLRKNAELLISGNTIRLFFGNINATDIFLNDKRVVAPSRTGVKSLVIPPSEGSKFKLPLFIYKGNGKVITSEEYENE